MIAVQEGVVSRLAPTIMQVGLPGGPGGGCV